MDTWLLLKSGFSPYCLAKDNKEKHFGPPQEEALPSSATALSLRGHLWYVILLLYTLFCVRWK